MKRCRVCNGGVAIELRQHNAAFCSDHFIKFCRDQVERTIHKLRMFPPDARVLVAVSGGKDSLALWDILVDLGYEADGMVITLGIGDYSDNSTDAAVRFAEQLGRPLNVVELAKDYGFTIPDAATSTGRVPCSPCGTSKRHIIDKAAIDGNYDVVVTGHNLDDEAAVLFGNISRWKTEYLGRQHPVLPARNGFPRKAKPLVRLGEREMAAYCVLRNIDYIVDECPMAEGNKHLEFKALLNDLEDKSPGSKREFYFGFLARAAELFAADEETNAEAIGSCEICGGPSNSDRCSFCRMQHSVTVELGRKASRAEPEAGAEPEAEQLEDSREDVGRKPTDNVRGAEPEAEQLEDSREDVGRKPTDNVRGAEPEAEQLEDSREDVGRKPTDNVRGAEPEAEQLEDSREDVGRKSRRAWSKQ